ncbi:MAG: phage tail tube protein [Dysosmobacter sp.]
MGKQTKVLHGSCSEVYINGVRDVLATKIEVKVTGDFEDGAFCGDYGTFPIYNGYSIEGTITDKKLDSTLEVAIAEGYRTGVMPDIVLITALTNPATRQVERWSVSGVVFTEVALANIEAKKAVERELPFKAETYKSLEAIE